MKITIEGEPKEIADLALGLQNRLFSEETNSYLSKWQNDFEARFKDILIKEISSTSRDNA